MPSPAAPDVPLILIAETSGGLGIIEAEVARRLLASGRYRVRLLTLAPASPEARDLQGAGAEVVPGRPADRASLRAALRSCYGVFAREVAPPGSGPGALPLIHTIAGSEIEHLVLVASPARGPSWERVEAAARALELPVTCLHPEPAGDLSTPSGAASLGALVLEVFDRPAETLGLVLPMPSSSPRS